MALPYIILVLGYTLIVALFLWLVIEIKGRWIAKFCVVPVILWFGLFLYYVPPQLAGYPSDQELHEDKVIVRYFTYNAPTQTQEGNLYVVVDTRFFKDSKKPIWFDKINPMTYADISSNEFLRLYRLPWDEELVNSMNSAQKKKQLIILKKNRDKGKGEGKEGKGKKKKKNGKTGKPGEDEGEGEGGTGGTAKKSGNKSKYSVEALTPNQVFKKSD